jgi:hypothetical protein
MREFIKHTNIEEYESVEELFGWKNKKCSLGRFFIYINKRLTQSINVYMDQ